MKKKFSTKWNSSTAVAKQRKYRFNAPLHVKQKFLSVHLSPELRKKHNTRSVGLRVGDKVKVLRGQFKTRENKVERVDLKKSKVYITGIERAKKDGAKSHIPLNPTNLMITELNLEDKLRKEKLIKTPKKEKSEKPQEKKIEPAKKE